MKFRFKRQEYLSSTPVSRQAWKKFFHNKLAIVAMVYIGVLLVISVLGYLVTPDKTPMANQQVLEIATKRPGFTLDFLLLPREDTSDRTGFIHKMLFGRKDPYRPVPLHSYEYMNDELVIKAYSGDDAIPGPESRFGPETGISPDQIARKTFLLGTDQFGRDVLSRLMIGSRVSFAVGLISVLISLLIGITAGSIGGFYRGKADSFIVWLINVVWSIPTLLLVIAITFALGKGFWQIFVAVGLTMWVEVARVTRGQVIAVRESDYVEAARALGFSGFRIIFRHILPNITGPIIVISAANFAAAILIEAGLSFLGIGVQPPMPSWGSMIRENYAFLILDAAWLAILPGIAIMLLVLAFMIVGNGLRDALDVKTSGRPDS